VIIAETKNKLFLGILMSLLVIAIALAVPAGAQEEPAPVPEPAQEEPAPAPEPAQEEPAPAPEPAQEEPEAAVEPAAAAAPAAAAPVEEVDPPMAAIPITYREKTLITIGGKKAQADGVVEFVVQPKGGEPVSVRVNVLAKSKPKMITDDVLKELDFAIDDRYKVNRTGDQKITVKALKKNPPIAITVKTQSLSAVSVTVGNG